MPANKKAVGAAKKSPQKKANAKRAVTTKSAVAKADKKAGIESGLHKNIAKVEIGTGWLNLKKLRAVTTPAPTVLPTSETEKKRRLNKIAGCVVAALAKVAKKDPSLIGPNTGIAIDLGINTSAEQSAVATLTGACLGIMVSGPFIAACSDVKTLIAALYKAIYKEDP